MSSETPVLTKEQVGRWLESFHEASKSLNAQTWINNFMTEDVTLQYANNPLLVGRDNVQAMLGSIMSNLEKMEHKIDFFDFVPLNASEATWRVYQKATIRYLVKGDTQEKLNEIVIPGFMVVDVRLTGPGNMENNAQIPVEKDLKVFKAETYLDATEVFDRMKRRGF